MKFIFISIFFLIGCVDPTDTDTKNEIYFYLLCPNEKPLKVIDTGQEIDNTCVKLEPPEDF